MQAMGQQENDPGMIKEAYTVLDIMYAKLSDLELEAIM